MWILLFIAEASKFFLSLIFDKAVKISDIIILRTNLRVDWSDKRQTIFLCRSYLYMSQCIIKNILYNDEK